MRPLGASDFFILSNQSDTYGCYTDPEESFLGGLP
jgi:hypothetical protein